MGQKGLPDQLLKRRPACRPVQRSKHRAGREADGHESEPYQPEVGCPISCSLTGQPIEGRENEVELKLHWNGPEAAVVGADPEAFQELRGVDLGCRRIIKKKNGLAIR